MRYWFIANFVCLISLMCGGQVPAEDLRPTFLMLSDPEFDSPESLQDVLPDDIVELWRSSLQRPEISYRLSAAIDIRSASQAGFEEVKAAIPELRQLLSAEETTSDVRTVVAQTLIELDAREVAEELFRVSLASDSQYRQLVEPALARWDFPTIRKVWRERLQQKLTYRRDLILACEGCGRVRDEQALPDLLPLVQSQERPRDVRFAAAKAAGLIASSDLEAEVEQLLGLESPPLINRLCAVALLQRHDSALSQEQLKNLFGDPAGPVATAAIGRLYEMDPGLILDLLPRAWEHPDVKVRKVAADCLIDLITPERIETLSRHLNDASPSLRIHIREALLEFAKKSNLEPAVRKNATDVLNADDWRGQEQASLILGQLDQETVMPRLVELLESTRPEVQIASAWALRKIAVKESLPALLKHAQNQTDNPQGSDLTAVDRQVAHLFEAMTIMEYRPVIPLMRTQVPKPPDVEGNHRRLSRGVAVWGLGYFLADWNDDQFAAQLMGRILDVGGMMPDEIELVRRMSAISLGRMKAESQLAAMKKFVGSTVHHDPVSESIRWAIQEISGEELPYFEIPTRVLRHWRIQPVVEE
ncbi:MAG: HEAT repeat domain-containing protein [Planctomycetaceae bacterium]|nr:HEAT repeat domain-containing protein [Planctomycetaceae bacterium]